MGSQRVGQDFDFHSLTTLLLSRSSSVVFTCAEGPLKGFLTCVCVCVCVCVRARVRVCVSSAWDLECQSLITEILIHILAMVFTVPSQVVPLRPHPRVPQV